LYGFIKKARSVMVDEVTDRFFIERPSNIRLVQIWMSKQYPAEKWLPETWHTLSKALYLTALRDAVSIAGMATRSSPRKEQKTSAAPSLVRNQSDDEDEGTGTPADSNADLVTDEAAWWAKLDKSTIREFRDEDGIVNEFALIYHVRSFPLHYIVFKQTASHLPHEGNSEQLFSRSGALSDDNGKMDPARLAVWTSIRINYKPTYQPSYEQTLQRYLLKFSKGGNASSLHEDNLGLLLEGGEDGEGGEYYVTPSHGG
jgi:hypothetical protein